MLVLLTSVAGLYVPCLEQLISLVGAFALASLAIGIPPILEIVSVLPLKPHHHHASESISMKPPASKSLLIAEEQNLREGQKKKEEKPNVPFVVIRGIIICLIGCGGAISGTYVSIMKIKELLESPDGCSK